jgi:hypothetical protein
LLGIIFLLTFETLVNSGNGLFLTLGIPLKEGIGGEREGDFMVNSGNGLFPYFADTTERGDRG